MLGGLLGRECELRELGRRLDAAAQGRGTVVAIEGPAGIGKTALLEAAGTRARAQGFKVLGARSAPLERDFPFGVLRQLYEPLRTAACGHEWTELLSGAAGLARRALDQQALDTAEAAASDVSYATLHGLYWLTANLAARGPALIAIDDVHWADPPSVRFLLHLSARLEDLPVVMIVTVRDGDPVADDVLVAGLLVASGRPLRPPPLAEEASREIVRSSLDATASAGFCRACHVASGGNPFLLHELVAAVRAAGIPARDEHAERVATVAPKDVARAVIAHLRLLPEGALPFGQALAVLGSGAPVRQVAALADLEPAHATRVADALRAARILSDAPSLEFNHPLVRSSLYATVPPGERALRHAAAAELLAREHADPGRVALHVLHTDPHGDPTVIEPLRAAARLAIRRGAPEVAARHLRRALEEPPPDDIRAPLLFELGLAEMATRRPGAAGVLRDAVALTQDPRERARVALHGARAFGIAGGHQAAIDVATMALGDELPRGDELVLLEAELIMNALASATTAPLALARLAAAGRGTTDPPHCRARALWQLTHAAVLSHAGIETTKSLALVDHALANGLMDEHDSLLITAAITVLALGERLEHAQAICEDAIRDAHLRGSLSAVANMNCWLAFVALRRGAISEAELAARDSLEFNRQTGTTAGVPWPLAFLLDTLVERDELAAAEDSLRLSELDGDLPDLLACALLLQSRARLHLARSRPRQALDDLHEAAARWRAFGIDNPTLSSWRTTAALAHLYLGDRATAKDIATEQLELSRRIDAPRATGDALRVAGVISEGSDGIALLRDAVAVLEPTPARLELARSLVELGAALRRCGERASARPPLRRGLDLAHRSGATSLARRAHQELLAAGARPRRRLLAGVDALTPSEHRVARLAAEGLTNREIAQHLYVTQRTIETHLRHTFQKLDVRSRTELASQLGDAYDGHDHRASSTDD